MNVNNFLCLADKFGACSEQKSTFFVRPSTEGCRPGALDSSWEGRGGGAVAEASNATCYFEHEVPMDSCLCNSVSVYKRCWYVQVLHSTDMAQHSCTQLGNDLYNWANVS